MADRQHHVGDLDAGIEIERRLDLEQHRTGVEGIAVDDLAEPPAGRRVDVAGMAQPQQVTVAYRLPVRATESAPAPCGGGRDR